MRWKKRDRYNSDWVSGRYGVTYGRQTGLEAYYANPYEREMFYQLFESLTSGGPYQKHADGFRHLGVFNGFHHFECRPVAGWVVRWKARSHSDCSEVYLVSRQENVCEVL